MALDPIAATVCPVPLALKSTRGDSINLVLRLYNVATGRPIVLTGWSGVANVYASPVGGQIAHTMTVDVDQSAANMATTGVVTISTTPNENLGWLEYGSWSLILTDGTTSRTVIAGPFELGPSSLAAPLFVCAGGGAAGGACGASSFETAGAGCDVLAQGYTAIQLPHPQAACACA